ncbi:hypothetical protein D5R81_18305 [Parashewanella spongiae]|uniref:Uncharacterized protein n=1 Tax=Parashewanella spongiae TaxID=342950 RepID=A0A3A6TWZ3_9GAMM|nr:hypothetical protein [Parashewanella spongiae]MCL1078757.1 hypothetical protein [Parashewanella spongiae]RJY05984.1 hypothetical protein D5R81_18305 [Parashewanella spongiae]
MAFSIVQNRSFEHCDAAEFQPRLNKEPYDGYRQAWALLAPNIQAGKSDFVAKELALLTAFTTNARREEIAVSVNNSLNPNCDLLLAFCSHAPNNLVDDRAYRHLAIVRMSETEPESEVRCFPAAIDELSGHHCVEKNNLQETGVILSTLVNQQSSSQTLAMLDNIKTMGATLLAQYVLCQQELLKVTARIKEIEQSYFNLQMTLSSCPCSHKPKSAIAEIEKKPLKRPQKSTLVMEETRLKVQKRSMEAELKAEDHIKNCGRAGESKADESKAGEPKIDSAPPSKRPRPTDIPITNNLPHLSVDSDKKSHVHTKKRRSEGMTQATEKKTTILIPSQKPYSQISFFHSAHNVPLTEPQTKRVKDVILAQLQQEGKTCANYETAMTELGTDKTLNISLCKFIQLVHEANRELAKKN